MHSTDDLQDGYLGSGKVLGYSRRKHGDENHTLEILEMCGSRELLKVREREIVNEELLSNPLNMNLKYGGDGGGKFWSEEHQRKCASAGGRVGGKTAGKLNGAQNYLSARERGTSKLSCLAFSGKKHSTESRRRISSSMLGKQDAKKNSQFGTCWVTNGVITKKIKATALDAHLREGFRRGRK
jgi:hypothetical protein